jgi:hypothetical protein
MLRNITKAFETRAKYIDPSESDYIDSLCEAAWESIQFPHGNPFDKFGPNTEHLAAQELARKIHAMIFPGREVDAKPGGFLEDLVERIVECSEFGDGRRTAEQLIWWNGDESEVEQDDGDDDDIDSSKTEGDESDEMERAEAVNNSHPERGKRKGSWAHGSGQDKKVRRI